MKRHYSGVFLIVGCWSQLVGGYDPSPLCPVAKSDRGDGGDMGRTIQGLEDLHHGFPVDRVGQRHHGFAFETVTGTPAITWGDFEGVLPSHLLMLDTVALNFLGITLVDGLQRLCSKAFPLPGETTACRPMWTRWMRRFLSTRALTATTLATEPSPPAPGAKFSRKRFEKEKAPQGRLFDSFA